MQAAYPKRTGDLQSFRKFDTAASPAMRRYIVMQFVAAAFFVLWIGLRFAAEGIAAVFVPCILLWSSLYAWGALGEARTMSRPFELFRIVLLVPAATFAMVNSSVLAASVGWVVAPVYSAVSLLALMRAFNAPNNAIENNKLEDI